MTLRDEKLRDSVDLIAWGWHAGVLTRAEAAQLERRASTEPRAAATIHARALRLREAIHQITTRAMAGAHPRVADVMILNRELTRAGSAKRFGWKGRRGTWQWDSSGPTLDRVLYAVAQSAAELFTDADLSRLRVCGGDDCGWLFEDTSRNGGRHWCDMRDCGNVAKVRRYRARQRRASRPGAR